jgi:hypothetical protein
MAVWSAEIKPVQGGSSFSVQVVAGSSEMAKKTIEAQWGEVYWMRNLRVISARDDYQETPKHSFEDTITVEQKLWLCGIFIVGYLIFTYWYISLPLFIVICLLCWWANT